jgi:hypothetical protein
MANAVPSAALPYFSFPKDKNSLEISNLNEFQSMLTRTGSLPAHRICVSMKHNF